MKYTENFKLKKPEQTDSYNVEDFNENADTVDAKLEELSALLAVEDISNNFIASTSEHMIASKSIFKNGNVISGCIIMADTASNWAANNIYEIFTIADAYKPIQDFVILNTLHSANSDIAEGTYEPFYVNAFIKNGTLYIENRYVADEMFKFVYISFSYICQ